MQTLRKKKLLLLSIIIIIAAVVSVIVIMRPNPKPQYESARCISFEERSWEFVGKGSEKGGELLELYKNDQGSCNTAKLPESKISTADRIDLYRRVSFEALARKDTELSKKAAKDGLSVYENLDPEAKKQFDASLVIVNLRELAEGKY